MMGKFATARALSLLILGGFSGILAFAQTTPADQTQTSTQQAPATNAQQPQASAPAAQQSGSQEASDEEGPLPRQRKPRDFNKWSYNLGGGANVDSGATKTFVRGGGLGGTFGVARNGNKYLGLRADFFYEDLPLKQSSLTLASATSANSYLLAFTVDPVINIPVTSDFGAYVLFGPGYFHRGGSLNSDTAFPGTPCNGFYTWWIGQCPNVSLPLNGSFANSSQNDFGFNIGVGITRKMPSGVEVYAEFRLMHGSANETTTDVRPITVGVRW